MTLNGHKHQIKYHVHPNEIGLWGIGCTVMLQLYEQIKADNPLFSIGYYDVKHKQEASISNKVLLYQHIHLQVNQHLLAPQIAQFFNTTDLLVINGNHEKASNMWLILDGQKAYKHDSENIEKTSIIFYNDQTKSIAESLKEQFPAIELRIGTDFSTISNYCTQLLMSLTPALNGLILTGGESSRMKENKSLLIYHQEAQWLHLYHLLQNKCEQTLISCSEKSIKLYEPKPIITDKLLGYGPLSGIISALLQLKNKAILVLACDLPLIDNETIDQLIAERDTTKIATTFYNEESGFLEPLITIYEPKALPVLLAMLAQGYTCPRKMLMQNDIKVIHPNNASALKNINHPEEKEHILKMLKHKEKI